MTAAANTPVPASDAPEPARHTLVTAMVSREEFPQAAVAALSPPSAPVPVVRDWGDHLDQGELMDVLAIAGWPEHLRAQAALVVAGPSGSCPTGESNGRVAAGAHHSFKGIFQLSTPFWFNYAGVDPALWADPVANARVAWAVYQYDIGRGNAPWTQWGCKPW